ncbi:hypothetical protein ERJ75_000599400 [Trypanosoma vivax]|nr:hypothetical protein ERJ75_000599400 [Trypanosoma vivax]
MKEQPTRDPLAGRLSGEVPSASSNDRLGTVGVAEGALAARGPSSRTCEGSEEDERRARGDLLARRGQVGVMVGTRRRSGAADEVEARERRRVEEGCVCWRAVVGADEE